MPPKTWKDKERHLAALFGTYRRALSGGRSSHGEERDDCEHDRLFLESKYSARHAIFSLWRYCRQLAGREARSPKRRVVLGLYEKGQAEALLVVHQDDLVHVAVELIAHRLSSPDQPFYAGSTEDFMSQLRSVVKTLF